MSETQALFGGLIQKKIYLEQKLEVYNNKLSSVSCFLLIVGLWGQGFGPKQQLIFQVSVLTIFTKPCSSWKMMHKRDLLKA